MSELESSSSSTLHSHLITVLVMKCLKVKSSFLSTEANHSSGSLRRKTPLTCQEVSMKFAILSLGQLKCWIKFNMFVSEKCLFTNTFQVSMGISNT